MAIGESTGGMYLSPLHDRETVNQAMKGYNHKIKLLNKDLERLTEDSEKIDEVIEKIDRLVAARKKLTSYASSTTFQKPLSIKKQITALNDTWRSINQLVQTKRAPETEQDTLKALKAGITYRLMTLEDIDELKMKSKRSTDPQFLTKALEDAATKGQNEKVEYILKKHPNVHVGDAERLAMHSGHKDISWLLTAFTAWNELKDDLILGVEASTKKSPHSLLNEQESHWLSDILSEISPELLAHFKRLHPKDAMHFLLEVVRPQSLGALFFYNALLETRGAESAHEVEGVAVDYDYNSKFQDIQTHLEQAFEDKNVVLLRNDVYSNVWLPIDLSENPEVWEVDNFAIAIIDKEGNGTVHAMPSDPQIQANLEKNASESTLEELD